MRRNEDIFKKLNRKKPLIKTKDLSPLSPVDFKPEKKEKLLRVDIKPKKTKKESTLIFEDNTETVKRKTYKKERLTVKSGKKREKKEEKIKREPEIFSDSTSPAVKEEVPSKIEIYPVNKTKDNENRTIRPAQKEASSDISISEAAAVAESALSFRHELKYYINYRDYIILRSSLKALMYPDPYAGPDNTYNIRSLYFDDINDSALREKIAGSDNRCKYRIRIYNFSDDVIKFEKKIKTGQYVAKKSILLSRSEYDSIFAGDCDFLKDRREDLAKDIYIQMRNNRLRPKVIVDYTREAYVLPFENCRVTFDKDLKAGLMLKDIFDSNAPVMSMYESGLMVLEVKFDKFLPVHVKRVLNTVNAADRSAISKYVISRKFD